MIKSNFMITGQDTKVLRHEKQIDIDDPTNRFRLRSKSKKIILTLTAHDSELVKDKDTETMDLSKKN